MLVVLAWQEVAYHSQQFIGAAMLSCLQCVLKKDPQYSPGWSGFIAELCSFYDDKCELASRALDHHLLFQRLLDKLGPLAQTVDERRLALRMLNSGDDFDKIEIALSKPTSETVAAPPQAALPAFRTSLASLDSRQEDLADDWSTWHRAGWELITEFGLSAEEEMAFVFEQHANGSTSSSIQERLSEQRNSQSSGKSARSPFPSPFDKK